MCYLPFISWENIPKKICNRDASNSLDPFGRKTLGTHFITLCCCPDAASAMTSCPVKCYYVTVVRLITYVNQTKSNEINFTPLI